jgi:hypothetical protein
MLVLHLREILSLSRVGFIAIGSIKLFQKLTIVVLSDELLYRQCKEPAAWNVHLLG